MKKNKIAKVKVTVNYGVIHDMEVELPVQMSIANVGQAFAEAYVKYSTKNALVHDVCLISSIGASHVRFAMVEGFKDRMEEAGKSKEEIAKAVELLDSDASWKSNVLVARHGVEKALEIMHGPVMAQKLIALMGEI